MDSQSSKFMAARVPDAPSTPVKISADTGQITIGWATPYNGGTQIITYTVQWNQGGLDDDFVDL